MPLTFKPRWVYPGHPTSVAYQIVTTFATYEKAMAPVATPSAEYASALSDSRIRGAGGNVIAGIEMLSRLRRGEMWVEMLRWSDEYWKRCDSQHDRAFGSVPPEEQWRNLGETERARFRERWRTGQEEADKIAPMLNEYEWWWTASPIAQLVMLAEKPRKIVSARRRR